jgi:hypothetical protein
LNIGRVRNPRKSSFQHGSSGGVDLAEMFGLKSTGLMEPEFDATDSGE